MTVYAADGRGDLLGRYAGVRDDDDDDDNGEDDLLATNELSSARR